MRYAIIPEFPEDQDLEPLADIICEMMGLPQQDVHPNSLAMGADVIVKIYQAIFNAYGVPTPDGDETDEYRGEDNAG